MSYIFDFLSASLAEAKKLLPEQTDTQLRYVELVKRGSLLVVFYAPIGVDKQTPHKQDEVYIIEKGSGTLTCGESSKQFTEGDVLFVPAGAPHHFSDFSDDFQTWAVFYGPEGGEQGN